MKINEQFPGSYLNTADLQGQPRQVTIAKVVSETVGGVQQPVMRFHGIDRALVLNKTNAGLVAAAYGTETNDWAGRPIELFPTMVTYEGQNVPAIRVRLPSPAVGSGGNPAPR